MCGGDEDPPQGAYSSPTCLQPTAIDSATDGDLVVERFPVIFEGYTYPHGRIAYVKGRPPRPVVLVHSNYAGLKQFDIDQACFLAKAGYVGLAVDSYKENENYKYEDRNPSADEGAEKLKKHFVGAFGYMNEILWAPRFWRALMGHNLEMAFSHPAVARGRAGAIGYCLGGHGVFGTTACGTPVAEHRDIPRSAPVTAHVQGRSSQRHATDYTRRVLSRGGRSAHDVHAWMSGGDRARRFGRARASSQYCGVGRRDG